MRTDLCGSDCGISLKQPLCVGVESWCPRVASGLFRVDVILMPYHQFCQMGIMHKGLTLISHASGNTAYIITNSHAPNTIFLCIQYQCRLRHLFCIFLCTLQYKAGRQIISINAVCNAKDLDSQETFKLDVFTLVCFVLLLCLGTLLAVYVHLVSDISSRPVPHPFIYFRRGHHVDGSDDCILLQCQYSAKNALLRYTYMPINAFSK